MLNRRMPNGTYGGVRGGLNSPYSICVGFGFFGGWWRGCDGGVVAEVAPQPLERQKEARVGKVTAEWLRRVLRNHLSVRKRLGLRK